MHELSLANALIEIVENLRQHEGFTAVRALTLSCGRHSCVDPEAFRFVFSVQARGTAAAGAKLAFDIRPAVLYCFACGREFSTGSLDLLCPTCGRADVLLTGGTEELKLLEMDVE